MIGDLEILLHTLKDKAYELYDDGQAITNLIELTKEKLDKSELLNEVSMDINTAIDLLVDWRDGVYTQVSKESIIGAIVCLIYIVDPFKIVPDFLKKLGLLGNITALVFLFKFIQDELDAYRDWSNTDLISTSKDDTKMIDITME